MSEPTGRPTLSPLREARRRPFVLVGFEEVGEAGKALAGGREVGKAILGDAQKGARAIYCTVTIVPVGLLGA